MGCTTSGPVVEEAHEKANPPLKPNDPSNPPSILKRYSSLGENFDPNDCPKPVKFKLSEIAKATNDFSEDLVLGEGEFGKVYKGQLSNHMNNINVVFKRLKSDSNQGQHEWLSEILTLGKLRHENLIKFYGYCSEKDELILVYEYAPLLSLDQHLFKDQSVPDFTDSKVYPTSPLSSVPTSPTISQSSNPTSFSSYTQASSFNLALSLSQSSSPALTWERRLRIAHGVAMGLAFLHENDIIHRDLKSKNILLDEDYRPMIADFGLAKSMESNKSHVSTKVIGTLGYMDPIYYATGHLSKTSDVFSYGVFLLEILSGRKAYDDGVFLIKWAHPFMLDNKPKIERIVQPSVYNEFVERSANDVAVMKPFLKQARKLIITARFCLASDFYLRPTMAEVANTLTSVVESLDQPIDK